ncbi:MAG: ABC transporter permease subunit [Bacteroidales bacterium]|nr:ABC transporter permease subunit [Bacteroidales bacterium]
MLLTIIKKEILEGIRGYKFTLIFISCIILLGFSCWVMYSNYQKNVFDYKLKALNKDELIFRKAPSVLSLYVKGTQEMMERSFIYKKGDYEPTELSIGFKLDFFSQLFPSLDLLYIVKVILSFLALIIGFDLICGEKRNGTLRLMLSNSVSRKDIILGKIIGNYALLITPFLISFLLYFIIINLVPGVKFSFEEIIRVLFVLLSSAIYLLVFFLMGVAISSLSKTQRGSIITCFIVWIFFIFIQPSFATIIAKETQTMPYIRKIEEQKQLAQIEIEKNNNLSKDALWDNIYDKKISLTLGFRNKLNSYINFITKINMFFPTGAYVICTTNMAQYGLYDEMKLRTDLFQTIRSIVKNKANNSENNIITNYSIEDSLSNSVWAILVLIFYAIGLVLLIYMVFIKYDVR